MDKLKDAIKYFDSNNPESIVLKDINELYEKGSDNVLREFKQLLSRHTKPIPPVKVYELVHEEEELEKQNENLRNNNKLNSNKIPASSSAAASTDKKKSSIIEPLSEKIENTFKLLTKWLCANRLDSFISLYADFKSNILERSILGLKNHLKS